MPNLCMPKCTHAYTYIRALTTTHARTQTRTHTHTSTDRKRMCSHTRRRARYTPPSRGARISSTAVLKSLFSTARLTSLVGMVLVPNLCMPKCTHAHAYIGAHTTTHASTPTRTHTHSLTEGANAYIQIRVRARYTPPSRGARISSTAVLKSPFSTARPTSWVGMALVPNLCMPK